MLYAIVGKEQILNDRQSEQGKIAVLYCCYPRMAVVSAKATVSSTSKQFDKVFFSF